MCKVGRGHTPLKAMNSLNCATPTDVRPRLTHSAGRRLITRTHTTTHAPFVELSLIAAQSANCPLESLQHSTSTFFFFNSIWGGGGQHFAIRGPKINTAGCVCVFSLCKAGVKCTLGESNRPCLQFIFLAIVKPPTPRPLPKKPSTQIRCK